MRQYRRASTGAITDSHRHQLAVIASSPIAGLRVLVVEDQLASRRLLCAMLFSWGCVVDEAADGEDAIQLCSKLRTQAMAKREEGGYLVNIPAETTKMPSVDSTAGAPTVVDVRNFSADTAVSAMHPNLSSHDASDLAKHTNVKIDAGSTNIIGSSTSSSSTSSGPSSDNDLRGCFPVHVILMDGNMPKVDGISATRFLRSIGIDVPIIGVTANALSEDQSAFIRAGANEIITKPIDKKKLRVALESYAKKRHEQPTQ